MVQIATRGDGTAVVMGDMNAETREALQRSGRTAGTQDKAWQAAVADNGWEVKTVGRATYRETSEIDYVAAGVQVAARLHAPEWRMGQSAGDHGAVWVRVTEDAQQAEGEERPKGLKLGENDGWDKEAWEAYSMACTAAWDAMEEEIDGEDPIERIRQMQQITHGVAKQRCDETREARRAAREKSEKSGWIASRTTPMRRDGRHA